MPYNRCVKSLGSRRALVVAATIVALALVQVFAFGAFASDDEVEVHLGAASARALNDAIEPAADPVANVSFTPARVPDLPVPEPPPADPYAPTPDVQHGTIDIPAIGLSQPLYEGVTLTAINRGPSHWPGSALPGELGNVVVAGHRTTYTRPFWDLHLLNPGDELIFTVAGERFVYELTSTEIVEPEAIHIIEQRDAHTATLFACHPRGSARQRIVGNFTLVDAPASSTAPTD